MARRLFLLLVLSLVLAAVAAGQAGAVGPFNPPVTVVDAGCRFDDASGDANTGADGTVRGFVSFHGGTCGSGTIRYFQGSGSAWTRVTSPYHGRVLATAWDGAASYLLYANGTGTHVTKRTAAGFTPGRRLSAAGLTGAVLPTGDLVAAGGKWWAVWSEQVGPGGEFAQTDLFQALTIGQGHVHDGIGRRRVTFDRRNDFQPSLVLDPVATGSDGRAVLSWTHDDDPRAELSLIRFARAAFDGRWTSRSYTPGNVMASANDLFAAGVSVYGAYLANGTVVEATNPPASLVANRLGPAGTSRPRVTHSGAHTFVAWNTPVSPSRIRVADITGTAGTTVTQATITAAGLDQELIGVSGRGGKLTVLGVGAASGRLWAISQR